MGQRFFKTFLTIALVMWTAGIAVAVTEEVRVKREIAAAKKAEKEAKQARLVELNEAWQTSINTKYRNWESNKFEDFMYDWNTKGRCKSQRTCAEPIIVSKFNCDQMTLYLEWTRNGEIVEVSSASTETVVYSLEEYKIYVETEQKNIQSVDVVNLYCKGKSY